MAANAPTTNVSLTTRMARPRSPSVIGKPKLAAQSRGSSPPAWPSWFIGRGRSARRGGRRASTPPPAYGLAGLAGCPLAGCATVGAAAGFGADVFGALVVAAALFGAAPLAGAVTGPVPTVATATGLGAVVFGAVVFDGPPVTGAVTGAVPTVATAAGLTAVVDDVVPPTRVAATVPPAVDGGADVWAAPPVVAAPPLVAAPLAGPTGLGAAGRVSIGLAGPTVAVGGIGFAGTAVGVGAACEQAASSSAPARGRSGASSLVRVGTVISRMEPPRSWLSAPLARHVRLWWCGRSGGSAWAPHAATLGLARPTFAEPRALARACPGRVQVADAAARPASGRRPHSGGRWSVGAEVTACAKQLCGRWPYGDCWTAPGWRSIRPAGRGPGGGLSQVSADTRRLPGVWPRHARRSALASCSSADRLAQACLELYELYRAGEIDANRLMSRLHQLRLDVLRERCCGPRA